MSITPNGSTGGTGVPGEPVLLSNQLGETTGRYIVVFGDEVRDDPGGMTEALRSVAGVTNVASSRDFEAGALDLDQAASADASVFAELGIAVVAADPEGAIGTAAASDSRIVAVEPELIMHAIDEPGAASLEYVRGYRDAVADLYEQLSTGVATEARPEAAAAYEDTAEFTWGLQATMASTSSKTGQGATVAVLDTGFDLRHPDFAGRSVTAKSFVSGQPPQDGHGHGTHCIGTSCGPAHPEGSRRYGVATDAAILVGKVLNNQGSGSDTSILAGINWAVANHAQVISMSLGADVPWVSQAYETAGRRALEAGSLIIAAAGNNAIRSIGLKGFVGRPANSQSIMAVAAIDSRLRIAYFSAASNPLARGGKVDIAGPGVAVYSSWPIPTRYRTISGTSMATPHVAGIAALLTAAGGGTGTGLWSTLVNTARRLSLPSTDVGAGLAQAPQ